MYFLKGTLIRDEKRLQPPVAIKPKGLRHFSPFDNNHFDNTDML